jgi:hypothetical protein
MKKNIFYLVIFLQALSVNANPYCGAILNHGIYDEYNSLDQKAEFSLVKSIHCNASESTKDYGGSIGYGGFNLSGSSAKTESRNFCKSTHREYSDNSMYKKFVKTASEAIVAAWKTCVTRNKAGFSHFITPTSDPAQFTYKIIYINDGKPYKVRVNSWAVSEQITCSGKINGEEIDSSGREILCKRNPNKPAIIIVNAGSGTQHLKRVTLPPYTPSPVACEDNDLNRSISLDVVSGTGKGCDKCGRCDYDVVSITPKIFQSSCISSISADSQVISAFDCGGTPGMSDAARVVYREAGKQIILKVRHSCERIVRRTSRDDLTCD